MPALTTFKVTFKTKKTLAELLDLGLSKKLTGNFKIVANLIVLLEKATSD
jgi:hypothetical protein